MKLNLLAFNISLFLVLFHNANCMNNPNSNVIKLTSSNFNSMVVNSADLWLVEFYGIIFIL
jgi:hypothetical protein